MMQITFTLKKYLIGILTVIFSTITIGQTKAQSFDAIEEKQDKIETLYVQVYDIIDNYPDASFNYVYENGEVTDVLISNLNNNRDRKQLEVYLYDIETIKDDILNISNRVGIYYVAENEPEPKEGYKNFYREINSAIRYPDLAEENEIEGVVYVKFIVDAKGEIPFVTSSENINANSKYVVEEMKEEAENAILTTSGNWKPATIGDTNVSHWVVVPVQFNLENIYFRTVF